MQAVSDPALLDLERAVIQHRQQLSVESLFSVDRGSGSGVSFFLSAESLHSRFWTIDSAASTPNSRIFMYVSV